VVKTCGEVVARLEKRRQLWYAVLDVPKDVQRKLGTKRFLKSTKQKDREKAQILASQWDSDWRAKIHEARHGKQQLSKSALSYEEKQRFVFNEASEWRERIGRAADPASKEFFIDDMKDDAKGYLDPDDPEEASGVALANLFVEIALGECSPLRPHQDGFLEQLRKEVTSKTVDLYANAIAQFLDSFENTRDVTASTVQGYVDRLRNEGRADNTVGRDLAAMRRFWAYLQTNGVVSSDRNPFSSLRSTSKKSQNRPGRAKHYEPFTPDESVELLRGALQRRDAPLATLILLALWTGARIESLCSLQWAQVDTNSIHLNDKTAAGNRRVPIHPKLEPVINKLRRSTTNEFVIPGLTVSEKTGARSNAVGKRFGHLKTRMGHTKHTKVFHSLRKTVVTQLEQSGVPETVTAAIVGHEVGTMTYGLYSAGPSFEQKLGAIQTLEYPLIDKATDDLLQLLDT
jgi:integrase